MRGIVIGAFRTLHPGWIMGMNVYVVPVPEGCIVVFVDLDDRHACTGNGQDDQGKYGPGRPFAECAYTAHSAPTVTDSQRQFKRLGLSMQTGRYRRCR